MAAAATAAAQPGVSVVSMSWGFAEGQAVFASDEATYDPIFNVPGVTFLASTGDYGAADPEYPAFSPNVVAVGGTTLTLNADNSYNTETGWGDVSGDSGPSISSGGGISLYAPEPSYQQAVQSTGYRTSPDVSLVADPNTGGWIADPYNLDPSNPFEVVGGTSLSTPAWAGLIALVNQGRAAAGESALNGTGPNETQQALYVLPQSDYNSITSGNNGYAAESGYNLVTGLGTPVASTLVPDLIAYTGPGTTYSGPTVGPLQDATLEYSVSGGGSTIDVFSALVAAPANGGAGVPAAGTPTSVVTATVPSTGIGATTAVIAPPPSATPQSPSLFAGHAGPVGPLAVAAPLTAEHSPTTRPAPAPAARPLVAARAKLPRSAILRAIGEEDDGRFEQINRVARWHGDRLLDELIADPAVGRVLDAGGTSEVTATMSPPAFVGEPVVVAGRARSVPAGPLPHRGSSRRGAGAFDLLLAIGFCGAGIGLSAAPRVSDGRRRPGRAVLPDAAGSRPLPGPGRTV